MAYLDTLPDPNYTIRLSGGDSGASAVPGPGFSAVTLRSIEPMMSTKISSARHEADNAYHHKWALDIEYNPLTCEEFHIVYAFLKYKKSVMEPFYVPLPQYSDQFVSNKKTQTSPSPIDYPKGTTTIEVILDGLAGDTPTQQNQMFKFTGSDKLYRTTRVETASDNTYALTSNNVERIWFAPSSISNLPPNTWLYFNNIRMRAIQIGDIKEYDLGVDGLFKFSITLEEALE